MKLTPVENIEAVLQHAWSVRLLILATEQASYQPRASTVRLHSDDRSTFEDLREDVKDLTRAIKGHTGAVEDQSEVIARHGRKKPE